jgi:hypothetical protein
MKPHTSIGMVVAFHKHQDGGFNLLDQLALGQTQGGFTLAE